MPDILSLLIAERDKLNRVVEILQGPIKRRGRPPGRPAAAPAPERKRRGMSRAARKAASKRMKRYWAARRKAQK